MKIAISGLAFAVTAHFEYIVRAFKRRTDCEVMVIGPYAGLQMPWTRNGVTGIVMPDSYDFKPDIPLQFNGFGQTAPIGYIEAQLHDFKPDLWLDCDSGFHLDGTPKTGVRATFMGDPHVLRDYYNGHKHNYQYVFNPQNNHSTSDEYYLPYAADPIWHSPIEDTEKIYDVALIGNFYAHRVEFMNGLRAQGKNVFFDLGPAKEDARLIYAQSRVGINWSTLDDLNARVFELMCMGIAPVMNRVPGMALFDEGVEYLGFDTAGQANGQIDLLLHEPEVAKTMGINARNKIIKDGHTWDDRVQTILEVTGLTNAPKYDIIEKDKNE
jgi:hypothetical protein